MFGGASVLGPGSARFIEIPGLIVRVEPTRHLDSAGEQLAFQRFNYARMQVALIIRAHRLQRLSLRSIRLLLAWMHRVLDLRSDLAQANMALVIAMSRRTQFQNLDVNEVASAGNYALLRSIDRFDCSRGYKFSTYACQGILQRILHVVESTRRYRDHFASEFDEATERDDSSRRRHDAQQDVWLETIREVVFRNRARLTDLECAVIKWRFGLGEPAAPQPEPMTLQEIGRTMGVTKERIRQIQKRALHKLRCAMELLMA